MSDLFGNHIVGFPTRRLKSYNTDIFLQILKFQSKKFHNFYQKQNLFEMKKETISNAY